MGPRSAPPGLVQEAMPADPSDFTPSDPSAPHPLTGDPLDVLIVGGGVCGTALLFELARYTDLGRVALVERYDQLAQVNSKATNNSQTIHCGDIETNYTLEKAVRVKRTAEMIVHYADLLDPATRERCVFRTPKMVLGVGAKECAFLRQRFEQFSPHFPAMELLEKEAIAEWEPNVALEQGKPRAEELVAIGIRRTYTAVDYEALSASFVAQAQAAVAGSGRQLMLQMGTKVTEIRPEGEGYAVTIRPTAGGPSRALLARHVVVNAGAHSLLMAQQMGFGLEYSCLPVAGSFYFAPDSLQGKVYTVQNDKLPFAAIHGDPDVRAPGKTRFGPTALLLPLLERYKPASFWEFLKVLRLDWAVLAVFWQLLRIADIRNYILKNLLFEVPWLRRRLFLADARKIVPGMALADLSFAEGYGGVRPQLINKQERKLMLGEASIRPLPGLVFNVTPSPGGTCCLGNAATDVAAIAERLGCRFDRGRLERELYGDTSQPIGAGE